MAFLGDGDSAAWLFKPLRIFTPATQAGKFDPDGDYIRAWLPELKLVNTQDLLRGEITPTDRRGNPSPKVIHKKQQAHFKALYTFLPKAQAATDSGALTVIC